MFDRFQRRSCDDHEGAEDGRPTAVPYLKFQLRRAPESILGHDLEFGGARGAGTRLIRGAGLAHAPEFPLPVREGARLGERIVAIPRARPFRRLVFA